jgi:outer membrane receptor protein involved in Fe transport
MPSPVGPLAMLLTTGLAASTLRAEAPEMTVVTVTGSRIPESAAAPLAPVITFELVDLERPGLDSLGKVLQQLPASTGSPLNTSVNNSGDGSTRIDLRGLDPKRTLVLLNGRRLPGTGLGADSSIDLDSIPLSMIERIEVLTSAATAVYGADAVAGVVNLITHSRLEGLSARVARSVADRGDGAITKAQATLGGGDGVAGSWILGLDHTRQDPVFADRRAYSAAPLQILDASGAVGYFGTFANPDGVFGVPAGNLLGLAPGDYARVPGATGQSAAAYRPWSVADTFNFEPYNYSQTPNTRTGLWLQGSLRLSGSASAFIEGLWHERDSAQQLAPAPYYSFSDGGPVLADGSTGIPAGNYYNPFGVDLGYGVRRFIENNDRGYQESVRGWRAAAGLRGEQRAWHWQLAAAYASSDAATHEGGAIADARLLQALGPSGPDAAGNIVCGARDASGIVPVANTIRGCVPVDIFDGAGSVTPRQIAYISSPLTDRGLNAQRLLNLDAQREWLALPAGPVAWAAGLEYRREQGRYVFDPLRAGGVVGDPLSVDVPGGSISARDVYLETRAPLVRDRPAARALDIDVGVRYANYSSFGGRTVLQSGVRWRLQSPFAVRLDYAQVFRAPSLDETFQAHASSVAMGVADPCGNSPTPAQQLSCAAHGVPGGAYVQSPTNEFGITTGGNVQLAPERGGSFDAGIDLLPDAAHSHLALDYFHTRIEGFTSQPGVQDILIECANHALSPACLQITRHPDGTIARVIATEQNFGRATVSGVDFNWSSNVSSRAGLWSLGALATYLGQHDTQTFTGGAVAREAGTYAESFTGTNRVLPRWRALGHLDWERGPWRTSYALQLIGRYGECAQNIGFGTTFCHTVPAIVYHDVAGGYSWGSSVAVRLGVNNLTNRDPPFINDSNNVNTDAASYRLLGRTLFAELSCSFR